MIITNILKGIRKRWIQRPEKPRFKQVSWLATRLLKNQDDTQLKSRQFEHFILHYIRPYEVLKTYQEIFVEEIYKFESNKSHPVIFDCGANIGISTIYFKTIYPNAIVHAFEPDANLFEILPSINSLKDKHIAADAVSGAVWATVQTQLKIFVESILGLKVDKGANRQQLNGVVELLIEIRKQAKANKDFATSDKIRNQLAEMGIQLKDEKDGSMSYSF